MAKLRLPAFPRLCGKPAAVDCITIVGPSFISSFYVPPAATSRIMRKKNMLRHMSTGAYLQCLLFLVLGHPGLLLFGEERGPFISDCLGCLLAKQHFLEILD